MGVRAIISLAVSLGWNIVMKPGAPAIAIARDGARLRMPTDTTINTGVFQGYLSTVMTHSEEFTPTIELMDSVIATHKKLSDSHQTRLRMAVGESAKQHRERMAAIAEGAKETVQGDHLTQHIEIPAGLTAEAVLPAFAANPALDAGGRDPHLRPTQSEGKTLVREYPFIARAAKGHSYESPGIITQEWSNGTKTYRCKDCDYSARSPAPIGGHRKIHKPKAPPIPAKLDPARRVPGDTPPTIVHQVKEPIVPEQQHTYTTGDVLEQVRALVSPELNRRMELLHAENEILVKENIRLRERVTELEGNWEALQSLLNEGRPK